MPEYSYKTNGLTLNYFCNNVEAKKTLVLIHGWTGGWEVWKPLIEEFSKYKIYALDLPGHNKSGHLKNYNINTYYPPLLDFVNSLPEDNLILVGHSLGSASSIEIASRSRKIQAMLLEDPPWFSENKNKSTSSGGQEAFFLENKPKWRTVLDAIFDYQKHDPEIFKTNPYWGAVRASYAFHHDINIWNVEPGWIWQDAPKLSESVEAKTILLGGNLEKGGLMLESVAKKVQANIPDCEIHYWDTGHGVRAEKPTEYSKLLSSLIGN